MTQAHTTTRARRARFISIPGWLISAAVLVLGLVLILGLVTAGGCAGTGDDGEPDPDEIVEAGTDPTGRTFVHLFEWRWNDIADECEQFLGPKGFSAVQVSPPNEHIDHSTWWARYQPVSYQLESRGGTRQEFIDMVARCEAVGVDIYADLVINHTADFGGGGVGVGGTVWSRKNHPAFPAYGPSNYHGECDITNYQDEFNVQNCELVDLPDLDTAQAYVQDQIAGYIGDLRAIGVAGFRIDAAKHMAPRDIEGILARAGNPEVFLEVIGAQGEAVQPGSYVELGAVTEFGYSAHLGHRFKFAQIADLDNVAAGKLGSADAVVFTDNHDNQRGHGAGGEPVTFKDGSLYNVANAFMLAFPYGNPKVMSSYQFTDTDIGPPAGGGGCSNPGFVCEHRWTTIANMVQFRKTTAGEPVTNWWTNGSDRIAFGRGSKGFIAINKEGGLMDEILQTGLPAGSYCNVAAGEVVDGVCTAPVVTVAADGTARIRVNPVEAVALHVDAAVSGGGGGGGDDGLVDFTCANGNTYFGQSVYVVGDIAELGNWDPAFAAKLEPTSYPTWTGTLSIGAGRTVEWKCVKRDEADPTAGVEWQPGANNVLVTPDSGRTSATASF